MLQHNCLDTFSLGQLDVICGQARWVAQVLSGRAKLPDEATMIKEIEAFYSLRASHGLPKRYTHCQVSPPLTLHCLMP